MPNDKEEKQPQEKKIDERTKVLRSEVLKWIAEYDKAEEKETKRLGKRLKAAEVPEELQKKEEKPQHLQLKGEEEVKKSLTESEKVGAEFDKKDAKRKLPDVKPITKKGETAKIQKEPVQPEKAEGRKKRFSFKKDKTEVKPIEPIAEIVKSSPKLPEVKLIKEDKNEKPSKKKFTLGSARASLFKKKTEAVPSSRTFKMPAGDQKVPEVKPIKKTKAIAKRKDRGKKSILSFITGFLIAAIICCIVIIVIVGVGIYFYKWEDPFTSFVIEIIPYPAAKVNTKFIKYSDWQNNVKSMKIYLQYEREKLQDTTIERGNIEQDVLDTLIKNEVARQLAGSYGIQISAEEIQKATVRIINEEYQDSVSSINLNLKKMFNWDLEDFKQRVIEPMLLFERLEKVIALERKYNSEAIDKVDDIRKKLGDDEDFDDLVKEYSEEEGAAKNFGKMPWWKSGQESPKVEEEVIELEKEEVSKAFVTSQGFVFIKLLDKKTTEDGIKWYKTQRILINTKQLSKILDEQIGLAEIKKYIKL